MPPFNQSPSNQSSSSQEKVKFDINTFNPSLYTRIEDMPEEARGYFMPISKYAGGGYRPNRKYEEIMYEREEKQRETEEYNKEFERELDEAAVSDLWDNQGEFSERYKNYVDSDLGGCYMFSLTADEIENLKKDIRLEDQEHVEAALKAWELFLKEYKFSGDEVGFAYNDYHPYRRIVCWRPDSNDENYRPHDEKYHEINQLPTPEERYHAFLEWKRNMKYINSSRHLYHIEEKFDDGTLFQASYISEGFERGRTYLGKHEVAGYDRKRVGGPCYFVTLPNGESGRVFGSTYAEYLKSFEAMILEIKGQ